MDTIFDFEPDKDRIDVRAYGFAGFADLTIGTGGGDSVIDLDEGAADGDEVTVVGVTGLVPGDFIFA